MKVLDSIMQWIVAPVAVDLVRQCQLALEAGNFFVGHRASFLGCA